MDESACPVAAPWYKSAVFRGILLILVTQAIAKAHQLFGIDVSAFGIDANSAADWLLEIASAAAAAYALHGRASKPLPQLTLTKKAADAVNASSPATPASSKETT